jgi:hypothetical protein
VANEPSVGFRWIQRLGEELSSLYPYYWIAVDPRKAEGAVRPQDAIVAVNSELTGLLFSVRLQDYEPLDLYYAFIRPALSEHKRRPLASAVSSIG